MPEVSYTIPFQEYSTQAVSIIVIDVSLEMVRFKITVLSHPTVLVVR